MPQIVITSEEDEALEALCPECLRGTGRSTLRVQWIIERARLAASDKKAAEAVAAEAERTAQAMRDKAWKEGRAK